MSDDWEYKSTGGKVGTIIGIGLLGAPVLYLAAFFAECVVCFFTCGKMWQNGDLGCVIPIWSGSAFINTFLALSIGGVAIGIIYAIAVKVQSSNEKWREKKQRELEVEKKEEEARKAAELKQQQGYASDFQRKSSDIIKECEKHKQNSEEPLGFESQVSALQEKLWEAVNDASIPMQKLADIVNDLEIRSAN